MIDWSEELIDQITSHQRAVLSYPGESGYPVTLPLPFAFDRVTRRFALPKPAQPPRISDEGASQVTLTLLRYSPHMKSEQYLLLYGKLAQDGEDWSFSPSRVVLH